MILFDLDGTFIDSSDGIFAAYKKSVNMQNIEETNEKLFKTFIGPPFNDMIEEIHPQLNKQQKLIIIETFGMLYSKQDYFLRFRPREGLNEFLEKISNTEKSGILTNKRSDAAKKIVDSMGLAKYFEFIAGRDFFDSKCPSKSIVLDNILKMDSYPSPKCYVGDTYGDYELAKNFKIEFVGIRSMFNTDSYSKDYKNTLEELYEKLKKLSLDI